MDEGEYHAHTTQSDDTEGSQSLESLLNNAFDKYGMDWMGISDHLRMSSRDDEGHLIGRADTAVSRNHSISSPENGTTAKRGQI